MKTLNNVKSFRSFIDEMKAVADGTQMQPIRHSKTVYASEAAQEFVKKLTTTQSSIDTQPVGINITNLAEVTRLMTKENQELLRVISKDEVQSIAELAKKVHREEPNLSRTLKKLANIGVVILENGPGRTKIPRLALRSFKVDIDVMSGSVTVLSAA